MTSCRFASALEAANGWDRPLRRRMFADAVSGLASLCGIALTSTDVAAAAAKSRRAVGVGLDDAAWARAQQFVSLCVWAVAEDGVAMPRIGDQIRWMLDLVGGDPAAVETEADVLDRNWHQGRIPPGDQLLLSSSATLAAAQALGECPDATAVTAAILLSLMPPLGSDSSKWGKGNPVDRTAWSPFSTWPGRRGGWRSTVAESTSAASASPLAEATIASCAERWEQLDHMLGYYQDLWKACSVAVVTGLGKFNPFAVSMAVDAAAGQTVWTHLYRVADLPPFGYKASTHALTMDENEATKIRACGLFQAAEPEGELEFRTRGGNLAPNCGNGPWQGVAGPLLIAVLDEAGIKVPGR